jgi:two-component system sensor histidine kinase TctE
LTGAARHPHLRRRLVVALALPMLLLTALGVLSDYFVARRLTDDAYDQSIAGVAEGLAVTLERDRDHDLSAHFHAMMRTLQRIDAPDVWRYVVLDAPGQVLDGDPTLAEAAQPPGAQNPQFRTLSLAGVPERVATFHIGAHGGGAVIVVAETLVRRNAATSAIMGATLWPNAALMALAVALALAGVRIALRPLQALGERINAQGADELAPLPLAGTPRETLPLLQAIDRLIERLRLASRSQQEFLDHAAHQLRTPLAALQARIELLRATPADELGARIAALHADAARLAHLASQLLTLGRTDRAAAAALERTPVDVPALIAQLAAGFDDRARARDVHLAFELAPLRIEGVEWMLREALMNLVDNAIAHAPPGTAVTLRCGSRPAAGGRGFIDVEDQGPGISPDQRERVFEPFVRLAEDGRPGSGLGLAIVRSIADRHAATVAMTEVRENTGTLARIEFH